MAKKSDAEQITQAAKKEQKEKVKISRRDLLSSGSTLLNLACTDNPFGSFVKGKYYFMVGDSSSGKTFLSMTCFAEACRNKQFENYRLIYDNVEDGCLMDLEELFGKRVAERVEAPAHDKDGAPVYSWTIEEFYYHLDDLLQEGKPFIYVLDSMDSLTAEDEVKKFEEHKKAHREQKKVTGSYGMSKAKKNSEGLRKVLKGLRDTGSILIVLCQTRDNVGFGFNPKTRSGGRALKFYATTEIWSAVTGTISKTVKGKTRKIGVEVGLKIEKNRITGKNHEVGIKIYPSYGIDDIESCIDYLLTEKWWTKAKGAQTFEAPEFDFKGTTAKLIQQIEEKDQENELRALAGKCWKEIQEACSLQRKSKYED